MKIKVITIISDTNNALAFEWSAEYINKDLFDLSFIFLNPSTSSLEKNIASKGFKTVLFKFNGKRDILKSFFQIFFYLMKERPSIIHTHLFNASLIGLYAAKLARIKTRIHTRHHSNSNLTYFPKVVKYDLLINKLSTKIIAISKNVADHLIAKENVDPKKIVIINHGIDFKDVENIEPIRIRFLRDKYNIQNESPVIGVISRYIHLKGIQFIIPAFLELLKTHPSACLLLANTNGNYSAQIKTLLSKVPSQNYVEIDFEEDLFALYKLFDIYIHTPIDKYCEAFGQTYIEALASKIPSIFTLSGIAREFIVDRKNALVVPFQNSAAIYMAIVDILSNQDLRYSLTQQGVLDVKNRFDIKKTVLDLESLYLS